MVRKVGTELSEQDKKLLNLIQEEEMAVPRITSIAHKMKLPTSTVKTKLNKFQKLGIIKGYAAVIDPDKVNRSFVAFNFSHAELGPEFNLDEIPQKLAKIPEVEEVYFITGEWDFFVKLRVKDKDEYAEVIPKVAHCVTRGNGVIAPKCFKDSKKVLIK